MAEVYANDVKDIVEKVKKEGRGVAGYIAESLQSCGGQIIYPKGYLQKVYDIVRKAGGVCISDEVQVSSSVWFLMLAYLSSIQLQVGFGRAGTHYWSFETQDVVPDIVTVAKPMGNGHPVGAVIVTREIAESFAQTGVMYFNTYGGNPVSCAIANAVMNVIEEEKLQENCLLVGDYLKLKTGELMVDFDLIGDVRGLGLFVGIELVKDQKLRTPATEEATFVVDRMKNVHKILVSSDGPDENVIKLKPPMVFNKENADQFLEGFRECLMQLKEMEVGWFKKISFDGFKFIWKILQNVKSVTTQIPCSLTISASKIIESREPTVKSIWD